MLVPVILVIFCIMTKAQALVKMEEIGKDRSWIAEKSGYSYDYVKNSLAPSAPELTKKFSAVLEGVFSEHERDQASSEGVMPPSASVWDRVMFSGSETERIYRAQRAAGYLKTEDLYHDAVISFTDDLLEEEKSNISHLHVAEPEMPYNSGTRATFELPCPGALAAGIGNSGDDLDTVAVSREYPPGYFATRILGDSMDNGLPDAIPDGSIAIFKPMGPNPYLAKGKIYAFSTPDGDVIKRFSRKNGGLLESLNPDYPPIPYNEEMTVCGEYVAVEVGE